jgi:DNA polymerase-3 subunit delta
MAETLKAADKTMAPAAYSALYGMTGFDLRVFTGNLEKLVAYVGDRKEIRVDDVEAVLQRTKIDPVYELTNALSDRKPDSALFFLNSILESGIHPLQVFAALINQIRRLLIAKDFTDSSYGGVWRANCSYDYFRQQVIPAIVEYDRSLLDHLSRRQAASSADYDTNRKTTQPQKAVKKKKPASDLVIAKNPKNAYPLYLLLKKTEGFTKTTLFEAVEKLYSADKQLKTGGGNPKLVLETVIFDICRGG